MSGPLPRGAAGRDPAGVAPRTGHRPHRRVPRRWVAAALVVLVGLAATGSFARWGNQAQRAKEESAVAEDGLRILQAAEGISDRLVVRMEALAGLFHASEEVTEDEFERFVADIGMVEGMAGIAFAPAVSESEHDAWLDGIRATHPGFETFGVDETGARTDDAARSLHVPILYFVAAEGFETAPLGLDLMSDPARAAAIQQALVTRSTALTGFLHLLDEIDQDGVVAFHPVTGPDGVAYGFIVAPFDLSALVSAAVSPSLEERLRWQVTDMGDHRSVGDLGESAGPVWTGFGSFGNRVWRIDIAHREHVIGRSLASRPWLVLPVGIAASLLGGFWVLLIGAGLDTRRRQMRLEAVVDAKDRFLASVSHRLRTPLTGVVGFLDQALTLEDESDDERWAMVSIAADQADEMASIVEDLIAATRSDPAALNIDDRAVDVGREIDSVLRRFPGDAEIRWEPGPPARVWADPRRVRQILRNLLANAAKYGRAPIDVIVVPDGRLTRIRVCDHGPGVPVDEVHNLFQPHSPINQPESQPDSLGIGLWASRQLARLMGGDLTYHRFPVPTFTLTLPNAPGVQASATPLPVTASAR